MSTTLCRDVVSVLEHHLAGPCSVTSPARLLDRSTGEPREVGAVVRAVVAGHPVLLAVEATALARPVPVTWVEQQVRAHRGLPTDRLLLVSDSGFTAAAARRAELDRAVPLGARDLTGRDAVRAVAARVGSVWVPGYELDPREFRLTLRSQRGAEVEMAAPAGLAVLLSDGERLTSLQEWVTAYLNADPQRIGEHVTGAGNARRAEVSYTVVEPRVVLGGTEAAGYVRAFDEHRQASLWRIEAVEAVGTVGAGPAREIRLLRTADADASTPLRELRRTESGAVFSTAAEPDREVSTAWGRREDGGPAVPGLPAPRAATVASRPTGLAAPGAL